MRFIELTRRESGEKIFFNVDKILTIEPYCEGSWVLLEKEEYSVSELPMKLCLK